MPSSYHGLAFSVLANRRPFDMRQWHCSTVHPQNVRTSPGKISATSAWDLQEGSDGINCSRHSISGRMTMIPSTTERVRKHTAECVNRDIRKATEKNVIWAAAGGPETIDQRIAALDREWDIERALEANAAIASLFCLTLGATVSRKWFLFPAIVGGFLLQHAIQGWCPPVAIMRRLGFRTQTEIETERYALKALRGDFRDLPQANGSSSALESMKAASR